MIIPVRVLRHARCECCNEAPTKEHPLELAPRCCQGAAVIASFDGDTISLNCANCKTYIVSFRPE